MWRVATTWFMGAFDETVTAVGRRSIPCERPQLRCSPTNCFRACPALRLSRPLVQTENLYPLVGFGRLRHGSRDFHRTRSDH